MQRELKRPERRENNFCFHSWFLVSARDCHKKKYRTLHVDVDAVYLDTDGSLNQQTASNRHHLALSTDAYLDERQMPGQSA